MPALEDLFLAGEILILPQGHAARLLRSRLVPPMGDSAQTRPPLAWHEWTASLWANLLVEGVEDRLLLNRLQEEHLWAEILRRHAADLSPDVPVSPSAVPDLAKLARSALQRASAYRTVRRLRSEADTVDSRSFARWLELFLERCRRDRLLSPALLDEVLASHVGTGALQHPDRVHLVGFERLTPSQQHYLDALSKTGVDVQQSRMGVASSDRARQAVEVSSREEQLRFAVRLVADQARLRQDRPTRFALVCPNPEEYRNELERSFRELVAPELEPVSADLSSTPWHFATQSPLSGVAVIADALDLLRWISAPLPLERIGQLLLSPFLAFSEGRELRARFDTRSSQRVPALRGSLDLSGFTSLLNRPDPEAANFPELRLLERSAQRIFRERARRSPADWTEQIRKLLQSVGWPGPRTLSAAEFRATEAWDGLLDLFATLQFDESSTTITDLLDRLRVEAGNAPAFAGSPDAPVQVLTLADAEALTFDLTMVLDATDAHLPIVERRNPLLPQALQTALGLGDPVHALTESRQALESLSRRSPTLILLAPSKDAGAQSELTPLASELGFVSMQPTDLLPVEDPPEVLQTESIHDPESLPLSDSNSVAGGVEVLQLQAACGFRAFATRRLAAKDAPPRAIGLDPLEGGNLLHAALELLWQQIGSRNALEQRTTEQRRELSRNAVRAAMARLRLKAPVNDSWAESYLHLLERRFTNLLVRWLDFELQRSPFTVLAQEREQELTIGPVRLKVRLDRIDEVAGGQVFVDYKSTYDLSSKHWLDARPDAPQLPAYALGADPDTLKGIAFAQVRPGDKMGWISLTNAPGVFPQARGKVVDLSTQLEAWRSELTQLAKAFADGKADVNPKSYPQTCQYCAHRLLCRLDPATLLEQDEDDEETPEEDIFG